MKIIEIELDGETYEVQELRSKANREWRQKLEEHFEDLASTLSEAVDVEINDSDSVYEAVRSIGGKVLGSVDVVTDLLREYDPDLPLDDAYDSEIIDAFAKVLELAYPFGGMIQRIRDGLGNLRQQTSQS
jgi:hypothetical protein